MNSGDGKFLALIYDQIRLTWSIDKTHFWYFLLFFCFGELGRGWYYVRILWELKKILADLITTKKAEKTYNSRRAANFHDNLFLVTKEKQKVQVQIKRRHEK